MILSAIPFPVSTKAFRTLAMLSEDVGPLAIAAASGSYRRGLLSIRPTDVDDRVRTGWREAIYVCAETGEYSDDPTGVSWSPAPPRAS